MNVAQARPSVLSQVRLLAQATRQGLRPECPRVVGCFGGALIVCLAALVGATLTGKRPTYFFTEVGELGRMSGLFTAASGLCLAVAGVMLWLTALRPCQATSDPRDRLAWRAAGVGFLLLGVDELAQVHEWVGGGLSFYRVPVPFGLTADLYVFLGYAFGAALVGLRLLPSLPTLSRGLPWAGLGCLCFGWSQAVDVIPIEGLREATVRLLAAVEEVPKVLGSWCFMHGAIAFHEHALQGAAARASRSDQSPGSS